jgi:hypothetical protein
MLKNIWKDDGEKKCSWIICHLDWNLEIFGTVCDEVLMCDMWMPKVLEMGIDAQDVKVLFR